MANVPGSQAVTKLLASTFALINNFFAGSGDATIIRDFAGMTNANVINDTFQLGSFKSTAMLSPLDCWLWWDAFGAGVTLNVGDVNHASGLASGLSIAAAGNGTAWKTFVAGSLGMPLWQALGYSSDPGGTLTLFATIAGANVANTANLAWQFKGVNR